jgi:hypothetical protein
VGKGLGRAYIAWSPRCGCVKRTTITIVYYSFSLTLSRYGPSAILIYETNATMSFETYIQRADNYITKQIHKFEQQRRGTRSPPRASYRIKIDVNTLWKGKATHQNNVHPKLRSRPPKLIRLLCHYSSRHLLPYATSDKILTFLNSFVGYQNPFIARIQNVYDYPVLSCDFSIFKSCFPALLSSYLFSPEKRT